MLLGVGYSMSRLQILLNHVTQRGTQISSLSWNVESFESDFFLTAKEHE